MESFERVKYLRKEILKTNQEDFAAKIKISRSNLGYIETGKVELKDRVAKDICDEYNVNPAWLESGIQPILIELDPDEEFAAALGELSNEHDPFIMEFIKRYWKLDSTGRAIIKQILGSLPNK